MESYYDYNYYKNSNQDTNKKNKKKGRVSSMNKQSIKNTTSNHHKHRQNSTKNSFYSKNTKNEKNVKNEESINLKPKKEKIDYKKVLEDLNNRASLLRVQILKKDDAIKKYKKKYEQQDHIIKDLEFIINDMKKNNEKFININDLE